MSFEAMAWAAKRPAKNSRNKLVLLMLANYADDNNHTWPSYRHLAQICECTERSVMRAVKQLEDEGALSIWPRFTPQGKQTSNLFILNVCRGAKNEGVGVPKTTPNTIRVIQNNKKEEGDKNNTPNENKKYSQDFEDWWTIYPRNDGSKKKAHELWQRVTKKEIDVKTLNEATFKFMKASIGKDKKFLPHATTWLNQGRWETVEQAQAITTNRNSLAG
ncbi:MAG: helix-turn-helix domain-containing protein [Flavobacteriaceae bacterium]|nr:helix-turn-helix domain-containing protein [Flavobacteriaceae bacterium]